MEWTTGRKWGLKRVRDGRRDRLTERKTAGWGLWHCIMHHGSSARVACFMGWCQGCHSCFTLCGDGPVAMAAAKQLISKYYPWPIEGESRALTLTDSRHQIIGLLLTGGGGVQLMEKLCRNEKIELDVCIWSDLNPSWKMLCSLRSIHFTFLRPLVLSCETILQ